MSTVKEQILLRIALAKAERSAALSHAIGACSSESIAVWSSKNAEIQSLENALKGLSTPSACDDMGPKETEDFGASYRTGAPGRPSPIQLVENEARRRQESGEALQTLKNEAAALYDWCVKAHPKIPAPTAKTIQNRIRKNHNTWKNNAL